MSISVRPANFIRLDLFPAEISTLVDDEYILIDNQSRVIVTNDSFYVFVEGEEGPMIATEQYLSDFTGKNVTGYTVTTEESTYFIKRAGHCGCGSRLRGFFPFPGVPFIKIQ